MIKKKIAQKNENLEGCTCVSVLAMDLEGLRRFSLDQLFFFFFARFCFLMHVSALLRCEPSSRDVQCLDSHLLAF